MYGGTKGEMERLLADAGKIAGKKFDLSNLNDVYEAIHVIQEQIGITGTTAKEGAETIEGSAGSLKAAVDNWWAALADPEDDSLVATEAVINSFLALFKNVSPIIERVIGNLPYVFDTFAEVVGEQVPTLIDTFAQLFENVISAIVEYLPKFAPVAIDLIITISTAILNNAPALIDAFIQVFTAVLDAFSTNAPQLIPLVVNAIVLVAETILNNLPVITKSVTSLMTELVLTIIKNIPRVIGATYHLGIDLINGIANGIAGAWKGFIGKLGEYCDRAVNWVKNKLGIHSPSRVMADQIGIFLPQGVAVGIEEDDSMEQAMANQLNRVVATAKNTKVRIGGTIDNIRGGNYTNDDSYMSNGSRLRENDVYQLLVYYLPLLLSAMSKDITFDGNKMVIAMSDKMDRQFGKMISSKNRGNV